MLFKRLLLLSLLCGTKGSKIFVYFISCFCLFLLALFIVVIVELLGSRCCWAFVLLLLHKRAFIAGKNDYTR